MYAFVMDRLQAAKGTWPDIARATGVSKRTIEKIASGIIADPGVSHIEKLSKHFKERREA